MRRLFSFIVALAFTASFASFASPASGFVAPVFFSSIFRDFSMSSSAGNSVLASPKYALLPTMTMTITTIAIPTAIGIFLFMMRSCHYTISKQLPFPSMKMANSILLSFCICVIIG